MIAAALVLAGCARPEPPPGGPEDLVPPVVVETVPDTFAVVDAGVREFFLRFNERISERPAAGTLDQAVVISPPLGAVRVRHSRDGLTVQAQQGLEPDRLYRVTVLPVVNDMFGNRLRDPFDLVLSTGEEFIPNVVAGMVEDRVTGEAVPEVRVDARFGVGEDTLRHWNFTGEDGVFSLRYVPQAPFELRAWQDRNRDGEIGDSEPQSSPSSGDLVTSPDTTFTVLTLIEPDTTPPRLVDVTLDDSVTLTFEFDDYLEPGLPAAVYAGDLILARLIDSLAVAIDSAEAAAAARLEALATDSAGEEADSTGAPGQAADSTTNVEADSAQVGEAVALATGDTTAVAAAEAVGDTIDVAGDTTQVADTITVRQGLDTIPIRFFHPHEYEIRLRDVQDSLEAAAAQALADSLIALGEPLPALDEAEADSAEAPPEPPTGLSGLLLPSQTVVAVLVEPLVRGSPYLASVSGALNIAGVGGGGGETVVLWELPPPDTTTADSLAADTLSADTLTADTLAVDTLATDTLAADTAAADTLAADTEAADTVAADTVPPLPLASGHDVTTLDLRGENASIRTRLPVDYSPRRRCSWAAPTRLAAGMTPQATRAPPPLASGVSL